MPRTAIFWALCVTSHGSAAVQRTSAATPARIHSDLANCALSRLNLWALALTYSQILTERLWSYQSATYPDQEALFDSQRSRLPNPPVFTREAADKNVIVPDDVELATTVLELVPRAKRHKWFRSMKSSQALAQSVFGNLRVLNRASCLSEVTADDDAIPAFGPGPIGPSDLELEHEVSSLNEVRPTGVDVLVSGSTSICVECKLSEQEVGCCSRPRLKEGHPEYCDGSFVRQAGRSHRCALAERGMSYWEHIPGVLKWEVDRDHTPCPLAKPYQLVRNVLAAVVAEGKVRAGRGHALLVYDDRNPAFQPRENGPFEELRAQLRDTTMLRRCSWQAILTAMDRYDDLHWLILALDCKYGLAPRRRHDAVAIPGSSA